jgi:hypothetical protein
MQKLTFFCLSLYAGPSLIDIWMKASGDTRKIAVSSFLNLWLVSGLMLCSACCFISRDEDRMKAGLKKIALSAASDLNGKEKEREQHDREASRSLLGIIESG